MKPERSISQEIGILWDDQEGMNASVTLFYTDFKDKITEVRNCDITTNTTGQCVFNGINYKFISDRINVDKAMTRGAEATFAWDINQAWSLATNYTFTQSEQKSGAFAGQPLNQMPKHMLNGTLNWKTTEDFATWIRANYRGKASEYLNRTSMGSRTPSYTFVDLGANYQLTKEVRLMGGVYNLLDKRVDIDVNDKVLDGRRYMVGASYDF